MKKLKKWILVSVLILVIIVSYLIYSISLGKDDCQTLALKFDSLTELGCLKLNGNADNTVGATLIDISEPVLVNLDYYDLPDEYHYKLTFRGFNRRQTFRLVNERNISIEEFNYKVGQFYKFDYVDVCGPVYSGGPHGGGKIFDDNDFSILKPFSC